MLLTSQTHVALDNSLERIVGQSGMLVNAVRIGQDDDERIATTTRKLMLDAKLPEMRKQYWPRVAYSWNAGRWSMT